MMDRAARHGHPPPARSGSKGAALSFLPERVVSQAFRGFLVAAHQAASEQLSGFAIELERRVDGGRQVSAPANKLGYFGKEPGLMVIGNDARGLK
jgi:hypothetical protein